MTETPVFEDGNRIISGESVTFPNMYPFSENHAVSVITREHNVSQFTVQQIADALRGQVEYLSRCQPGYASINWNYLPSAGASLAHPHMQVISDRWPTAIVGQYLCGCSNYLDLHGRSYFSDLRKQVCGSDLHMFGDETLWYANPVPLGEKEVRGLLPVSTPDEMEPYIESLSRGMLEVIRFYQSLGSCAFNASIFFDMAGGSSGFQAFCSMIARINPNPDCISDSAFMERLHQEPVILTLPESLAGMYRDLL